MILQAAPELPGAAFCIADGKIREIPERMTTQCLSEKRTNANKVL